MVYSKICDCPWHKMASDSPSGSHCMAQAVHLFIAGLIKWWQVCVPSSNAVWPTVSQHGSMSCYTWSSGPGVAEPFTSFCSAISSTSAPWRSCMSTFSLPTAVASIVPQGLQAIVQDTPPVVGPIVKSFFCDVWNHRSITSVDYCTQFAYLS